MRTYSHLITTLFIGHRLKKRYPVKLGALSLGSFLPDIPLAILTIWFFLVPRAEEVAKGNDALFGALYDSYYFGDPIWIVGHNTLHAPILIAFMLWVGRKLWQSGSGWGSNFGASLFWFGLGCGIHSLVDIFTHHDDGPLLLFPFEWTLRYEGPISYWHPAYHGELVGNIEHLLDLGVIMYFVSIGAGRLRDRSKEPPQRTANPG